MAKSFEKQGHDSQTPSRRDGEEQRHATSESAGGPGSLLNILAVTFLEDKFRAAADRFVAEMVKRTGCSRVSLGWRRRQRTHLVALSHAGQLSRRSGLVHAIEAAMDEALDQGRVLRFPEAPSGTDVPPACGGLLHADLARRYDSTNVCTLPVALEGGLQVALTLEGAPPNPLDGEQMVLCEAALRLVVPFLDLLRCNEQSLAAKAAGSVTHMLRGLLGSSYLRWKLAAVALVLLSAFFTIAEAEHHVIANARLEGSSQRAATAPFDGYVRASNLRAGDVVQSGEVLCELDDGDLQLEHAKWQSERDQVAVQKQQALARREAASLRVLSARLDQAQSQVALLQARLSRTRVVAPIAGMIIAGNLSQSIGAPVKRGDVLFEIAPLESYRLVLEVDEREIADILPSQKGAAVLAALPLEKLSFSVERLTPVSLLKDGRTCFRVECSLKDTDSRLRPGMEGVARIRAGKRRLIWIWTHAALDWLRLSLWTWLP